MTRKKRIVLLNPDEFPVVTQMLNDITLNNSTSSCFDYKGKKEKWIRASAKIGWLSKKIGQEFIYPPSTSRLKSLGFMNVPPNIDIKKHESQKQIKFVFTRKIF